MWPCVLVVPSAYDFQRKRCSRNAEMLQIWKILFSLNPCGCNDFSFSIQNFFRVFSTYFSSSYSILVSFSCSIIINCECLMNLWPGNRKCWSAWSNFCLLTSFRWLFSVNNYFIFTCVLFVAWHILFGILGIYFCNWGYCMFWRFCVWRHFWSCWLHLCTT